ncbi:protein ALWAYS EARLY 2 [Cajanus cajan]|uniref:protein ALWAYS EARLY 2 n=1 Tax=Cajanus cajan TaxID=3821 RepID=UPI00098DADB0|nr:protein ALWAYS EARLY 2 [Cajanus cajan]
MIPRDSLGLYSFRESLEVPRDFHHDIFHHHPGAGHYHGLHFIRSPPLSPWIDIDCMPLNPLDNMPEALRTQVGAGKASFMTKEPQINGNSNFGGCETHSSPVKEKVATVDNLCAPAGCAQSCKMTHHQAKEADIQALSELKRVLDKKETLLMELQSVNSDIIENQSGIECLKD